MNKQLIIKCLKFYVDSITKLNTKCPSIDEMREIVQIDDIVMFTLLVSILIGRYCRMMTAYKVSSCTRVRCVKNKYKIVFME